MTKKVLIIEDEPSIANIYKLKLKSAGYSVEIIFNGLDAVGAIKSYHPDIILLDLMLPGMGGEKVLEKIRNNPKNRMVPVVIITNISKAEAPRTLWHLGIHDYIVKASYTPAMVLTVVDRVLADQAGSKLKPTTL
jgi:DNA-binding response OmpR family regulator